MAIRRRRRKDWTWLWLFLLALIVRFPFLHLTRVLQTEGTTYVTLAHNLLTGHGYVGILGERELVMVSIFPHLIAGLGLLTGDLISAGRILALLTSAALVIPVTLLAREMFWGRAGLWAGLLVAFHPYLAEYAPLVRVESPFLFVWMFGIYATWRAAKKGPRTRWTWAVPVFFGLAYLLKSEGAVYFALSMMILIVAWWRRFSWPTWVSTAVLQGLIFVLLALPMILWLSTQTGRLTFETKGIVNYGIAARIARGMDYYHAAYGLGPEGTPAGPLLDRNRLVLGGIGPKRPALERPAYRAAMVRVLRDEWHLLQWPLLGRFWILFAVVGFISAFARGYWREVFFPLWYLIPALLGVATILFVWTRYLLPVIPLAALWISYGIEILLEVFITAIAQSPRRAWRLHTLLGLGMVAGLILTHPYVPVVRAHWKHVPDLEQQAAGQWLRRHDPRPEKRIMSTTSQVPFYAGGIHVPMPVDDPARIPAYVQLRQVNYVVISEVKDRSRPVRVWLDPKRVPAGWSLIYDGGSQGRKIRIYRVPVKDCGCGG